MRVCERNRRTPTAQCKLQQEQSTNHSVRMQHVPGVPVAKNANYGALEHP